MPRPLPVPAPLLLLLVLAGCNGGGDTAGNRPPTSGSYMPYAVGDRWVYDQISEAGTFESTSMLHVHSTTEVEAAEALVVHRVLPGIGGYVPYTMRLTPTELSRLFTEGEHGSVTALPQFQLPLAANTTYTAYSHSGVPVVHDDDGIDDAQDLERTVSIAGVETISVPLGTFSALKVSVHDSIRFHYSSDDTEMSEVVDSTIWYAPGVGPIKQTDTVTYTSRSGQVFGGTLTHALRAVQVGDYRSDRTAPRVSATEPARGATFFLLNAPDTVIVTFNEAIDPRTVTTATFTLTGTPHGALPGSFQYYAENNRVGFKPGVPLAAGSYTARLEGVTDLLGNVLPAYSWTFRVGE